MSNSSHRANGGALRLVTVALVASGLLLSSCSLGGGETLSEVPPGIGEDEGDPAPPSYSPGAPVVARLQTENPDLETFLIRGTFPVPVGTYPRGDQRVPFTVLDWDGSPAWTQVETVARYPDTTDGASVVEVMARVRPHPGVAVGSQVTYDVHSHLLPTENDPLPALHNLDRTRYVLPYIVELLSDPEAIEIAAYDIHGNRYSVRPLDGTGVITQERIGRVHTELKISQTMVPDQPVGGSWATLPHLFGVHTYISTYTGQEVVRLDVRLHNGHSGLEPGTDEDDPLDRVYFQRIEVSVPETYHIQQQFEDPSFRTPFRSGGRRIARFVDALPGGSSHVMRWQAQFHRRMMISTTAALDIARGYLDGQGQAFCMRGAAAGTGELYSWWRADTANYFPQRHQLPSLDHAGLPGLRSSLNGLHDSIQAHLVQGTGQGGYPIPYGAMGWMHPYGVSYGGMTGGTEIYNFDGVTLAATGSRKGYRYYQALHRMQTSRQAMVLYDGDGTPSSVEDWLVDGPGSNDYVPFNHFQVPFLGGSNPDPFGFGEAPQHQIQYASSAGREPWYQGTHLSYDPHDFQHFIRYTRSAKVLAWLGNDSLAKDDLLAMAEAFHLSYHPYNNNAHGGFMVSGMRSDIEVAAAFPGLGMPFGRGESWGSDAMIACYALGDDAWRAAKYPWFRTLAQLLSDAQASCTGFIQAQHMGSVPIQEQQPSYFWRQLIEQAITENMMVGLKNTVFEGVDPAHEAMVRDTIIASTYGMIGPLSWEPGVHAPWQYTAVGMNPDIQAGGASEYWCDVGERPANGRTSSVDDFQNWSSFAYGYELTGDIAFLNFAETQLPGTGGLLLEAQSQGANNIENTAALVALAQALNGLL